MKIMLILCLIYMILRANCAIIPGNICGPSHYEGNDTTETNVERETDCKKETTLNNDDTTEDDRRAVFGGGCLKGYDRTEDGRCEKIF